MDIIIVPAQDLDRDLASILAMADPFASNRACRNFCNGSDFSPTRSASDMGVYLVAEERARALRTEISVDQGWEL